MVKELEPVDHIVAGDKNFLSQYENSILFKGFANAFIEQINELEDQFVLFMTELQVGTADGVNLNHWGDILQAPQRPVSDDDFRVLLYALSGAYYSEGRPSDIVALVTSLVTADFVKFNDIGGAIFSLDIFNPTWTFDPTLLATLVRLAKPLAVEFEGFTTSLGPYFAFDLDTDPQATWFSVQGGLDGGHYTIIII